MPPSKTTGRPLCQDSCRISPGVGAAHLVHEVRVEERDRVDVVMDLLKSVSSDARAEKRMALARTAAEAWMARQGGSKGFAPRTVLAESYSTLELGRHRRQGATLGILDLAGEIEVTEPDAFLPALARGFGRAKAWGCGLMLIRRAR